MEKLILLVGIIYIAFAGVIINRLQRDVDNLYSVAARNAKAAKDALDFVDDLRNACKEVDNFTVEFIAKSKDAQDRLYAEIESMKETIAELPVDEIRRQDSFEREWNEGVSNILNYNPEIPKLKMEGAVNER